MKQKLMQRIITTVLVLALIIVQVSCITPVFYAHAQASLLTPQNAVWKSEALATAKWDAVDGADYYVLTVCVYVDGELKGETETGTTSTETDVQQQIRNLAPEDADSVNVSFCVKAQNREESIESAYSESSAEIEYYLRAVEAIETPTDIKLSEDGLVSFKQVDGAAYYTVTLFAEGDGGWVTDTTEYGYVDFGYMYLDISEFMARYYRDRGYYGETVQFYVEIEAVSTDGRASQISEKSNFVEYYIESPLHTPEFVSLEKNEDGQYIYTFKCEDEIVTYYDFQLNMEKWVNRDSDEYSEEPGGKAFLTIIRIDPDCNESFTSLEEPGYYSVDISNILRGFSKSGWSLNTDYPIDIGIRIRSVFSVEGEEELYSNYSSLGTVKNYNEPALLAKIENPVIKLDGGKCILSFDAIPDAEGYDVEYHIWGNNIAVGAGTEFWLDKCVIDNGTCYIDMTDIVKNEVGIMECEGELLYFSLSVRAFGNKDNYEWAPYSVESNRIRCYKYGDVLENLILAPANPIIAVGNTLYLGKTVVPDNGYYENIEWTSDNNDAISVNNEGCLTGISEGQATITALVDNSVEVSVVANSYVVLSNIEDKDEAEYIEDISGDIIDDIGNNDNPDLSHTDINEDDLETIKEEIHSGIENGDTFHTDIKEIQKTFEDYKNNWGQIQKAARELNVKYADAYNIDIEMYHKDKDGTEHHIGNITELENEITFTIDLVGNSGNYVLVRVHKNAKGEEEYEQIDYTVNEDGSITVKSNKFSDFVIMTVEEEPVTEEPSSQSQEPTEQSQEPSGQSHEPTEQSQEPSGQSQEPSGQSQEPTGQSPVTTGQEYSSSGNYNPISNNTTKQVDDNKEKQVETELLKEYSVNLLMSSDDAGTVSGGGTYKYLSAVTVEAKANDGYSFVGWMENGEKISSSNKYTFNIIKDKDLTAVFENDISSKKVDGNMLSVDLEYSKVFKFTGEKITAEQLMQLSEGKQPSIKVNLDLNIPNMKELTSGEKLIKVALVTKNNKNDPSKFTFYVKLKLNKTAKEVLDKKDYKYLKKDVKAINKELKAEKCQCTILPLDLSTSDVTVKVKMKKNKMVVKNGKVTVKRVSVKIEGKTKTLNENDYNITIANEDENLLYVTGKNNYTGTVEVKATK